MLNWDNIATWCQWIAPIATMIAAIMTAANLGTKVTGWGFAVFLVGSTHWTLLGIATGQMSLLVANSFLCLINAVGIWRWLGMRARLDDGAKAAERKSEAVEAPALLGLAKIEGGEVTGPDGRPVGCIRGAMVERDSGRLSYVVIACGGVGGINETLHSVPWEEITPTPDGFSIALSQQQLAERGPLDAADWPATASAA